MSSGYTNPWKILSTHPAVISTVEADTYFGRDSNTGDNARENFYNDPPQPYASAPVVRLPGMRHLPRPHQAAFVAWAQSRELTPVEIDPGGVHGGILGDECGLGKTYQVLSLVAGDVVPRGNNNAVTLVVAPANVIGMTWKEQIAEHVEEGHVAVHTYIGQQRSQIVDAVRGEMQTASRPIIILTSYETLQRELSRLDQGTYTPPSLFNLITTWQRIVFDEAHSTRNRSSAIHAACTRLIGRNIWYLTATAFVNRMDDYYAAFRLLGLFTSYRQWATEMRKAPDRHARLQELLRSHCIRRSGAQLLQCVKHESYVQVKMQEPEQQALYQFAYRERQQDFGRLRAHMARLPRTIGRVHILRRIRVYLDNAILRLLQLANHPYTAFAGRADDTDIGQLRIRAFAGNFVMEETNQDPASQAMHRVITEGPVEDAGICVACFDRTPSVVFGQCRHPICEHCAVDLIDAPNEDSHTVSTCVCGCKSVFYADLDNPGMVARVSDFVSASAGGSASEDEDIVLRESSAVYDASEHESETNGVPSTLRTVRAADLTPAQAEAFLATGIDPETRLLAPGGKILSRMRNMSGKHTVLLDCLSKLDPSVKVVLCCRWTTQLRLLELELRARGHGFSTIEGRTPRQQRASILEAYEASAPISREDLRIMIMQSQTCTTGINIRTASIFFLLNKEFNVATEEQQMSRVHRLDQVNSDIHVVHLVSHHSIEKQLQRLQRTKARMNADVVTRAAAQQSDTQWEIQSSLLLAEPNPARAPAPQQFHPNQSETGIYSLIAPSSTHYAISSQSGNSNVPPKKRFRTWKLSEEYDPEDYIQFDGSVFSPVYSFT